MKQRSLGLDRQTPAKRNRRLRRSLPQRISVGLVRLLQKLGVGLRMFFLGFFSRIRAVGAAMWFGDQGSSEDMIKSFGEDKAITGGSVRVLRQGPAMRVIFFYPGEEGTYIDNVEVMLFENGIVHIRSKHEETTTHLQNCEILWAYQTEKDDKASKIRLLKPKRQPGAPPQPEAEAEPEEREPGTRAESPSPKETDRDRPEPDAP